MINVELEAVFRKVKETRYGMKPQLSIKTTEHGDKWLSTWKVKGTENWKKGDKVAIVVEENGDFLNFTPASGFSGGATPSPALEARVAKLEAAVFGAQESKPATPEAVIQADEIADEDLPDMGENDGF